MVAADSEQPVGPQRQRLPLDLERRHRLDLDRARDQHIRRLAQQDAVDRRSLLESCGDVDGVARHEALPHARVPGDDFACIDADAYRESRTEPSLESRIEQREPLLHLCCRANAAERVVLVGGGHPEYADYRVPDELFDDSAVGLDGAPHLAEVSKHQLADGLGVDPLPSSVEPATSANSSVAGLRR